MLHRPRRFRLLIADDDVGFRETVQEILTPRFETIAVTGVLSEVLRRRAELIRFYAVLEMPPHPQRLVQTVENALIETYAASA